MKEVLPSLVPWTCPIRDFCLALAALVGPVQNNLVGNGWLNW
jgi:hypothetical protein